MADIRTIWFTDSGFAGWQAADHDLVSGDDIETAVLNSLFSDRLANEDDITDDGDRRGWWGDTGEDVLLGSRLWLLSRSPLTRAVARKAEVYAEESLGWLVTDGVLSAVSASSHILWPDRLYLTVSLIRPVGSKQEYKFEWLWGENNAISTTYAQ